MSNRSQSEIDFDEIVVRSTDELRVLLRSGVLVTGGSGFVGRWIISALSHAAERLCVVPRIASLNRSTRTWQINKVKENKLTVINADVTEVFRVNDTYGYVFHCATPASALMNATYPSEMQRVIEVGADNVIECFSQSSTRVINVSSGAVYGVQPSDVQCLDDDWRSNPRFVLPESAYHRAKVVAEAKFDAALAHSSFSVVHARLFAFLAPFLPLDQHFAAGNFLKDALSNRQINITGDGRTVRTYMYGTDLVVWLLAAAVRGLSGVAYNIGSPHETTIAELAAKISEITGSTAGVHNLGKSNPTEPVHRYVPCTTRTEQALGVQLNVELDDAIKRTVRWIRESPLSE